MLPRGEARPDLQRTHLLRDDLDWLPPSYKAIHWTVAGTLWAGLGVGAAAAIILTKFNPYLYFKGFSLLGVGGYYAGEKAARAALRSRLSRLAHGDVDLSRLRNTEDGELVHVRARVKARGTVPAFFDGEPAAYRRLVVFAEEVRVVHETAIDFHIVGEDGTQAIAEVASSRLIASEPPRQRLRGDGDLAARLFELALPAEFRMVAQRREARLAKGKRPSDLHVSEIVLRDGEQVELVGYKNRVVDPSVMERLEREVPMRATLRGGDRLPLLIAPAT